MPVSPTLCIAFSPVVRETTDSAQAASRPGADPDRPLVPVSSMFEIRPGVYTNRVRERRRHPLRDKVTTHRNTLRQPPGATRGR